MSKEIPENVKESLRAIGLNDFPGGVRVQYTAGFEENKVPIALIELIENMAAYKLLTFVGPLIFPYNSVGISIDGTSQSVSTPGPQFLAQRIKDLEGIIARTVAELIYFPKLISIDNIQI